ncbi:MAG: hypothetical protein N5P05_001320 [Chroococcopsis gigantea SAG 12.99]|jgi:uncharacterized repeat protein (TIGR02059 family)|nr:FG-GAP repeat protein [Chlorogloea purpurea SAG 13.99]MDV2999714.1 hypothetical protein [Chroococcopsis gigantea SAG 12.99]
MSIDFADRLSAVATDSAGITHIVWVEAGQIWHAQYDNNAQTWVNAQVIVSPADGQRVSTIDLLAADNLIQSDSSNIPGLAVVWQQQGAQGNGNDGELYYTAARYDENQNLQWLQEAKQLTSDTVADREPRIILQQVQQQGANTLQPQVVVVGQKVNTENATAQSIREDTDTYYQTFTVKTSDFSGAADTSPPPAVYIPPTTIDGSINGYNVENSEPNNLMSAATTTSANSNFNGWGFQQSVAQLISTDSIVDFLKLLEKVSPGVPTKVVEDFFGSYIFGGAIKGTYGGNQSILGVASAFEVVRKNQRDILTDDGGGGDDPLNSAFYGQQAQKPTGRKLTFTITARLTSQYQFNNQAPDYPLKDQITAFSITAGIKYDLLSWVFLKVQATGSIGVGVSLNQSPIDPSTYQSPIFMGTDTDTGEMFIYTAIPPIGSVLGIAEAIVGPIVNDTSPGLQTNSYTWTFPLEVGLSATLGIPGLLQLLAAADVELAFAVKEDETNDSHETTVTLGFPIKADVKLLGFLNLGFQFDPSWTWTIGGSSSSTAATSTAALNSTGPTALQTLNATGSGADVSGQANGSLLQLNFNSPLDPGNVVDPGQFTLTATNSAGQSRVINIFQVYIDPNDSSSAILRLNDPLPSGVTLSLTYSPGNNPGSNLDYSSGESVSGFSALGVNNSTPNSLTYTYNPTSGNGNDYSNGISQPVLSGIAQDFNNDGPVTLATTASGEILLAWVNDAPPLTPISAVVIGDQILLTFIQNLNAASLPGEDQFSVNNGNGTIEVTNVSIIDNTVLLNLSGTPNPGDSLTLNYGLSSAGNNLYLIDATGTKLWVPGIENLPLNAPATSGPPALIKAGGLNKTITVIFDQELVNTVIPNPSQFTVIVNGTIAPVSNVTVNPNSVVLSLNNNVRLGDVVTVSYAPDSQNNDNNLQNNAGQTVGTIANYTVVTSPTELTTVIKTAFTPFGSGGISNPTTIPGTDGLNIEPESILGPNNQNILVWSHADTTGILGKSIPGQTYSPEEVGQISNALGNTDIYYSVLNNNQWSIAAAVGNLPGSDGKVALGIGPNGQVMAAWLNSQTPGGGEVTTGIYWSSWNGSAWSDPSPLGIGETPDPLSQLNIVSLNGQPAIFWTETKAQFFANQTLQYDPLIYLRLDETSGTTAVNLGSLGAGGNGTYSGDYTPGQTGALIQTNPPSGDPDKATQFTGGQIALGQAISTSSQGFTVALWVKTPSIATVGVNLVSMAGLFSLTLDSGNTINFSLDESVADGAVIEGQQSISSGQWAFVVATYSQSTVGPSTLNLYINGAPVGSIDNVNLSGQYPTTGNLTIAGTPDSDIYLDEVAYYNRALQYSDTPANPSASQIQELTGEQFTDLLVGTNQIGQLYASRYVTPKQAGPQANYSVWDGNAWKQTSQINAEAQIIPTQLSDANAPVWDIVSPAAVAPDGRADIYLPLNIANSQGKTITSIEITSSQGTWFVGGTSDGNSGNIIGVVQNDRILNSASGGDFNHRVLGTNEQLDLFIESSDPNVTSISGATITVGFNNNTSLVLNDQSSQDTTAEPNTTGPTEVLGIATVTEANDSSLALIDSGFIIPTANTGMGYAVAGGDLNGDNNSDVVISNRGYTDSQGNTLNNGSIQILFGGPGSDLESASVATLGVDAPNSGGVIITDLQDAGVGANNLPNSLAIADVDGDGINDLIVGLPNYDNSDGAIAVIYGSYLKAHTDSTIDLASLPDGAGYIVNGPDSEGQAGFSVAAGNFDGDNLADIVFGSPYANEGDGAVYILYGNNSRNPKSLYKGSNGANLGYAVAVSTHHNSKQASTFDNSQNDMIIIGAPGYQISVNNTWNGLSGLPSSQQNQDLYPSSSSIQVGAAYFFSNSDINNNSPIPSLLLTGPDTANAQGVGENTLLGSAIAVDDWDGDGVQDVALSAIGALGEAGSIYVLRGGNQTSSSTPRTVTAYGNKYLQINGGLPKGQAGITIKSAGDVNKDNYKDFFVGGPLVSNGTGQNYVLFGPLDLDNNGTFSLNSTATDNKTTFLLNGTNPYDLAGTAISPVGDINDDGVDDVMLTAPGAEQAYVVYGHPWLADDGSIKLSDISADNGFVIDGDLYNTFTTDSLPTTTANSTALINNGGVLYLAGTNSDNTIYLLKSSDGGQTWSDPMNLPGGMTTSSSPSIAFYNGVLYLTYQGMDADKQINITYSNDDGNTWSAQYQIPQSTSTSPALVVYQNQLLTIFTSNDSFRNLLYVYSSDPQSNASWSEDFTFTPVGSGNLTSASAPSATVLNDTLYVGYQPYQSSSSYPNGSAYIASTSGTELNSLSPNLLNYQYPYPINPTSGVGLTSDSNHLYLSVTDTNNQINLVTSTDGSNWSNLEVVPSVTTAETPTPTVLNGEIVIASADENDAIEITSSALPYQIDGGSITAMLGDLNGDGFADVFSGGPNAGVIVFGGSTKSLLDGSSGTKDLIVRISNSASIDELIALGDYNGDSLADFGVLDANNNFYLVSGGRNLGNLGSLSITTALTHQTGITRAAAVGDYNGDGYDDVILNNNLYLGNAEGNLADSTAFNTGSNTVINGVGDVNGDGYSDIGGGNPNANLLPFYSVPNGQISTFSGNPGGNSDNITTINPPTAPITAPLSWSTTTFATLNVQRLPYQVSPSVAVYNGYLYMVYNPSYENSPGNWIATGGLSMLRSANGYDWEDQTNISDTPANDLYSYYQPSLAVFGDSLYMAFVNENTSTGTFTLKVAEGSPANNSLGLDFDNAVSITSSSPLPPKLISYGNELYVFYGVGSSIYYRSSSNPSSSWSDAQQVPNVKSLDTQQIGVTVLPGTPQNGTGTSNEPGKLILAYSSISGSTYTIVYDGTNWTNDQTLSAVPPNSGIGPSLTTVGNTAYLFTLDQQSGQDAPASYFLNLTTSTDGINWSYASGQKPPSFGVETTVSATFFQEQLYLAYVQGVYSNKDSAQDYNQFVSNRSYPFTELNQTQQLGSQFQNIGDFNGDGIDDLAVLAPGYISHLGTLNSDEDLVNNTGAVFIYYGSTAGIGANANPDVVLGTPALTLSTSPVYQLGNFSAVGDVNGDGFDDLAIASPNTALTSQNTTDGEVFLVFGGSSWGETYSATNPFDLGTLSSNATSSTSNPLGFVIEGLPSSQAGISLSGGNDVNGDGFSDFIVGAPGNNDNLGYTIFGSDFNDTVNQTGTVGNDVMVGTPTGESFIAGEGDDRIYTNGGIDVAYGGPGDDLIAVEDTYFRRLDGGTGVNTLKFRGYSNLNWDLTTLSPGARLKNFQVLDIQNYGNNILTLSSSSVNLISPNSRLTVEMDDDDFLQLSSDFVTDGTVYQFGQDYYQYRVGKITVLVNKNAVSTSATLTPQSLASTSLTPQSLAATDTIAPLITQSSVGASAAFSTPAKDSVSDSPPPVSIPDAPTTLSVSNPKVSEAEGVANFTIGRRGGLSKYVLVSYVTRDSNGKAGDRYLPLAGRVVFAPDETTKTVSVKIPNDLIYTGTRRFGLLVSLVQESSASANFPLAFNIEADPHGEQIRRWKHESKNTDSGVLAGAVQFDTTTTNGQANVDITVDNTEDINSFFNYNPRTGKYEEMLFDGSSGARFTSDDGGSNTKKINLTLKDGNSNDSDGKANGLVKIDGYAGRTIPGLMTNDNKTFWVATDSDGQVQWRLIDAPDRDYEFGWVKIDDLNGNIDGLRPGEDGYRAAALARKQTVFSTQESADAGSLNREIALGSFENIAALQKTDMLFFGSLKSSALSKDSYYMLYSKQGESVNFSVDSEIDIQSEGRGYHQLSWGGLSTEVGTATFVMPGVLNEPVQVTAQLSRASLYENAIALYRIDNLTGGLDTNDDKIIDLQPNATGYAEAALKRALDPLTGSRLTTPGEMFSTGSQSISLQGNGMYGMVIVPQSTIEEVLKLNPNNLGTGEPVAFFSFAGANPDGVSHVSRLGSNLFGFEDLWGGGDLDYNDTIVKIG